MWGFGRDVMGTADQSGCAWGDFAECIGWGQNGLVRAEGLIRQDGLAQAKWIGSGKMIGWDRMDWLGQNGLVGAEWFGWGRMNHQPNGQFCRNEELSRGSWFEATVFQVRPTRWCFIGCFFRMRCDGPWVG